MTVMLWPSGYHFFPIIMRFRIKVLTQRLAVLAWDLSWFSSDAKQIPGQCQKLTLAALAESVIVFLCPAKQNSRTVPRSLRWFFPRPFQIIIHHSSYRQCCAVWITKNVAYKDTAAMHNYQNGCCSLCSSCGSVMQWETIILAYLGSQYTKCHATG